MSSKARLTCTLLLATLTAAACAQDISERGERRPPQRAETIPTEGFWPTQRMMERFIDRMTGDMAENFEFDDSQLELTRELFKARFPEFLNANRAEIQTLLNQYFEALLNDEAPAVEEVAEWAARVQPLMLELDDVCQEVAESMREYLNDDQTVILDAQYVTFQTGMRMVHNKLAIWSDGGYDPETEWIHKDSRRHSDREREAAEEKAIEEVEVVEAPPPKDEWTIYTVEFIERYELNEEQQQKAFTMLRHQQEARDRYLRRSADEMARVTKLLTEAETEEEKAASLEAYERLNAPVGRIFDQLKQRLDTLPTRAQRKAAIDAGRVTEDEQEKKPPAPETSSPDAEREKLEELGYTEPPATQPTEPQP